MNGSRLKKTKEIFDDNLGISFQGEAEITIKKQLEMVQKNNIAEAQLRFKDIENPENQKPLIEKFRKENPDKNLSFHLSSNLEKINQELKLTKTGDLVTIHPPTGKIKEYCIISPKEKMVVNERAINLLADLISKHDDLIFAIENMGQNVEEMKFIVGEIRRKTKTESVGITLDINHVLMGLFEKTEEEKTNTIEQWFKELKSEIRCLHFAVPGIKSDEDERELKKRFEIIKRLYILYGFNVPLYLETKKDLETTQKVFDLTKR
jgi:hypothetical protein